MTTPNMYRRQFYKEPPKRTLKRALEGTDAFMEVMRKNALYSNYNDYGRLSSDMFAAHPDIPQGYFDTISDDHVLMVYEGTSDRLIRKDHSILTLSGLFYDSSNPNVYHQSPYLASELVDFKLACYGDEQKRKAFTGRIVFVPKLSSYIELDFKDWKLTVELTRFIQSIRNCYLNYVSDNGLSAEPDEDSVADPTYLAAFTRIKDFSKGLTRHSVIHAEFFCDKLDKDSFIEIPNESEYFGGLRITSYSGIRTEFLTVGRHQMIFPINMGDNYMTNLQPDVFLYDASPYLPFVFGIKFCALTTTGITANKPTRNNDGELMSYASKVHEYKMSYLMTPSEESFFKDKDKEYRTSLKKWKDEKMSYEKTHKTTYPISKPTKHPHDEPIFLGLELEVNARPPNRSSVGLRTIIKKIADSKIGNHMIMKSDGSIGSYGIEMVTVPATLAYHKQMFIDHFFSPPNEFHKMILATDQCGIHVHISKKSFTELDLGKFMTFINKTDNAPFIDAVANRPYNMYCVRNALAGKNKHGIDVSAKVVGQGCKGRLIKNKLAFSRIEDFNRRQAVNLQNAHTVEVRAFKSSNDKNNILRKLEFCESLVRFVRQHSMQQMTLYDYVNFMLDKSNKSVYKHMIKWLASKDYIGHERKKLNDPKTGEPINKLYHVYSENLVPNPHPTVKPALKKKEV